MKARTSGAGARVIQWRSGTLRLRPGQATNSCPSRFFSKAGRTGVSDHSTSSGQAPHENWSWLKMEKRKPEIIRDNKKRGEWAESVFVAREVEHGLEHGTPFGEGGVVECVVRGPGEMRVVVCR